MPASNKNLFGLNINSNAAAIYMVGSALLFSVIPLFIARSNGADNPFFLNAGWRLGLGSGCALALLAFYRSLVLAPAVRRQFIRSLPSRMLVWGCFTNFGYALFAWSTRYIEVSVTAVLYELWPILTIFIMARLFQESGYRRNLQSITPFLLLALVGAVLTVSAQTGGLHFKGESPGDLAIGVPLALLAALAASLGVLSFRWGQDLASELPAEVRSEYRGNVQSLTLAGSLIGLTVVNLFGTALNAAAGLALRENPSLDVLLTGFIGGLGPSTVATILFRVANLKTQNLGVNALSYLTPALALAWLEAFSEIQVARIDYLVVGVSAIVAAQPAHKLQSRTLSPLQAPVISLWACAQEYRPGQENWPPEQGSEVA